MLYQCLQNCRLVKCCSKFSQQRAENFRQANLRIRHHLEIKNIIKISNFMKIFRRIFWANETKQLISKLQLDGLLQDDAEFFDNQNIDLEEALDDFFNVEEKYRKCYTERKKFQELAYQVQNESSHANKITTKNSRISQGVKNLLKNETRRTLFNLDLYENEDRNNIISSRNPT